MIKQIWLKEGALCTRLKQTSVIVVDYKFNLHALVPEEVPKLPARNQTVESMKCLLYF